MVRAWKRPKRQIFTEVDSREVLYGPVFTELDNSNLVKCQACLKLVLEQSLLEAGLHSSVIDSYGCWGTLDASHLTYMMLTHRSL